MRSALAHQIGRPKKAIGTGGDFGGFGSELVVGFAGAAGVCRKGVAKPAQGESGGLSDSHDVPASGDGMAEGMNTTVWIKGGTISGGKNDAGGADSGADRSSSDDAHAGGSGGLIARTCYNGSANAQTGFRSSPVGNFSADIGRFVEGRQQALIDFGYLQHVLRPAAMGHVEK